MHSLDTHINKNMLEMIIFIYFIVNMWLSLLFWNKCCWVNTSRPPSQRWVWPNHKGHCRVKILHFLLVFSFLYLRLSSSPFLLFSFIFCLVTKVGKGQFWQLLKHVIYKNSIYVKHVFSHDRKTAKWKYKICDKGYYSKDSNIFYVLHIGTNLTTGSALKSKIFTKSSPCSKDCFGLLRYS